MIRAPEGTLISYTRCNRMKVTLLIFIDIIISHSAFFINNVDMVAMIDALHCT